MILSCVDVSDCSWFADKLFSEVVDNPLRVSADRICKFDVPIAWNTAVFELDNVFNWLVVRDFAWVALRNAIWLVPRLASVKD